MGPWIFLNTNGFWLNGLRRKSILEDDPKKTYFPGNWKTSNNRHCLIKWIPFVCVFLGVGTWLLLVNLEKSRFSQKLFFSEFRLQLGRPGGVQGDRTDRTKTAQQISARFGLTWHRKVHFSTFSGKLTFQSTRNGPQNLPFCPGSLQDTFIIYSSISHQHIFENILHK